MVFTLYVNEYEPGCGSRNVTSAATSIALRFLRTAHVIFRSTRPGLDKETAAELSDGRKNNRFSSAKVVVSSFMTTENVDGAVSFDEMGMPKG